MPRIQNSKRPGKRCSWPTDTREFVVAGRTLFGTDIATAAPGSWIVVHDACTVLGVVLLGDQGEALCWMHPPAEKYKRAVEKAVREAFGPWL